MSIKSENNTYNVKLVLPANGERRYAHNRDIAVLASSIERVIAVVKWKFPDGTIYAINKTGTDVIVDPGAGITDLPTLLKPLDHLRHFQSCNCLADKAICCQEDCLCKKEEVKQRCTDMDCKKCIQDDSKSWYHS